MLRAGEGLGTLGIRAGLLTTVLSLNADGVFEPLGVGLHGAGDEHSSTCAINAQRLIA